MKKRNLIIGLFLIFVIIILGCAQKEQFAEKSKMINTEKPQESPQVIKENVSTSKNQQIFDEISNTNELDSALKELDSVE